MRLTIFALLIGIFQSYAVGTYAQTTRLNLEAKNSTVKDILTQIEEQSEFFFLYNSKLVDVEREVNLEIKDKKISETLAILFEGTNTTFKVVDRQIVLTTEDMGSIFGSQQQNTVSGKVEDTSGNPLPGVTVMVKGTTSGTITNADGFFTLGNVPSNSVLVFSFVGMKTQEIQVAGMKTVNVVLSEEAVGLEEVVAIGYGTQKKVNLTGSVTAIADKELQNLKVTQTSQLLVGLASGVTVLQGSGQPGKDNVTVTVRGLGTFSGAGNRPLVLVDGLASSLDNVNINDVASISILKDAASASIYGTRAANGVILVTTKKGKKGEFRISYQGSVGLQRPSEKAQLVDSWVYAEMYNEALTNAGGSPQYSAAEIAKFKSGEDPDNYPNVNHYDYLITSGSGLQTDHYLNFTGGTDKITYLLSTGYLDQTGIVAETYYKRFNVLLNVESQIKDNLKLNIKLSGQRGSANEPTAVDKNPAQGVEGLINYSIKIPSTYAGKKSDGYYGNQTGFTIEGWMDSESFIANTDVNAVANASLDWEILKSLTLTGKAGYEYSTNNYKFFRPVLVVDQFITQAPSDLTVRSSTGSLITLQGYLNYDLKKDNHNFHLLSGYSQESYRNDYVQAFRDNFPNNSLYEINAGAASNQQTAGSAYEWALRSYFGRINYDYQGKYLFEANARYDGSSRFPEHKRYGLFPSASLGWRISEEKFFKVPFINDLKLRASVGTLGNQNIGNYPYQQLLSLGLNAPFGVTEKLSSGAAATTVPNSNITWESTFVADAGFDISFFQGKLNLNFDYFDKLTSGILYNITASKVLGLTPSVVNAGKVSNKGIDLTILHKNSFGDFSYSIAGNFSYVKNEVKELANVTRDINNGLFVGESLESIYGYVAEGLFVDQNEITSYAVQPRTAKPGDIKFKDISGPQGVPDGKVDADYDRKIIGNTFPKYNFGLNLNAGYKNFDLSVQLQGIAGLKQLIGNHEGNAFFQGSSIQQWMVDERWTKDNPDPNAKYPRLLVVGGGEQQFFNSTYILLDGSYLRVSNLQLGYTLPGNLVAKAGISHVRFYIGVKNLLTLDHFREGWDPEQRTGYPPVRYSNIGVNINF